MNGRLLQVCVAQVSVILARRMERNSLLRLHEIFLALPRKLTIVGKEGLR